MLPKIISFGDLRFNEALRREIGNAGFEYMLLVDQDPQKINSSSISKKIFSVHAPLLSFSHSSLGKNKWFIEFVTNWIYGPARFPNDRYLVAEKTIQFAKNVGAKIAVFHTYHFDQQNIPGFLDFLAKLENNLGVTSVIEHEGAYIHDMDGFIHDEWTYDPIKMIKFLDKAYPKEKFQICYDTCSQISNSLPVMDITKVWQRVAIVHLADSAPGRDLALEISSQQDLDLINFLYEKRYRGLIHAEINGAIGLWEELIGKIYGVSASFGLPIFKDIGVANAQRHIKNSCQFLLNNL